jgi:hypothetical protein
MLYKQVLFLLILFNSKQFPTKNLKNKMNITINPITPPQVPIESLESGSLFKDANGNTFILLSVVPRCVAFISIKNIGIPCFKLTRDYVSYPYNVTPLTVDQANTHISLNIATQDK